MQIHEGEVLMTRRYLVAGNWKMNGNRAENAALVSGILQGAAGNAAVEILVCPPALYVESVGSQLKGSPIQLGAQNLSDQEKAGAFTGEIQGAMLRDVGCQYVLVGHSERRALYGETDEVVARKFRTAQLSGLVPVLCVGETLEEREAGRTESVLARQLQAVLGLCGIASFGKAVIAYEPVWAIGTGKTATAADVAEVHAHIRATLAGRAGDPDAVRILYGGSVKPSNAAELMAVDDVDGALVGGASLVADDFWAIAETCR